jgi:NitT/TauT family transport system substrate-binding protein
MTVLVHLRQLIGRVRIGLATAFTVALSHTATAQEKVSLRLDWVNSGYHAIWYYAVDTGIFRNDGIDLEVLEGRGSAVTAQTVGNGSVMFGTADTGSVMVLVSQGLPVKIVAGYLRQSPLAIIFPKKNNWTSFSDLGKTNARIGYAPGGASAQILPAVLKATGLEGKVRLINMEPAAKPTALLEGKVDAIESFDFLQVPLLEANGMPAATLPYASAGVNVPGLSLISSTAMIEKNPALVRKMVGLMQSTIEAARANPDAAIDSLLKRTPTLNRAVVTQVLKLSFNLLETAATKDKPLGWLPPDAIAQSQDVLVQYGGIKKALPIDAYFTNELVPGT